MNYKHILLLLLIFIVSASHPIWLYSATLSDPVIPITENNGDEGEGSDPNQVFDTQIGCVLTNANTNLQFLFYVDLGSVNVSVMNASTGEFESSLIDSQLGIVDFPISGNAGHYSISIITSTGRSFYGHFTII